MSQNTEPKYLVDLVQYQEGTVVSRTLIKKDAGSVTLFAFDIDQGLSEHTTPFDAMVCVLDGNLGMTISGSTANFHPWYTQRNPHSSLRPKNMLARPCGQ